MVPRKRQKGASSSTAEPEQEYDRTKFVSFIAQKKYVESSVKRGVIQKRGLYVTMDSVAKQVEKKKWEELVKHPEAAVVLVAREFYANIEEHKNFHVFVRGKWWPLTGLQLIGTTIYLILIMMNMSIC